MATCRAMAFCYCWLRMAEASMTMTMTMVMMILLCGLNRSFLAMTTTPVVHAFSIPVSAHVRLETAPLMGGPAWLPVHVKVVVDEVHVFDYVPRNATSTETLQSLLSLKAVPAEARIKQRSSKNGASSPPMMSTLSSERASQFCQDYTKDLHLIENNCWTFAYDLVQFLRIAT